MQRECRRFQPSADLIGTANDLIQLLGLMQVSGDSRVPPDCTPTQDPSEADVVVTKSSGAAPHRCELLQDNLLEICFHLCL